MRAQEQSSLHASQKTYKNNPLRRGAGFWRCGKTAAASRCLPRHFIVWADSAAVLERQAGRYHPIKQKEAAQLPLQGGRFWMGKERSL